MPTAVRYFVMLIYLAVGPERSMVLIRIVQGEMVIKVDDVTR